MKHDPVRMFSGGFVPVGALLRCTRAELYKRISVSHFLSFEPLACSVCEMVISWLYAHIF